jgi:hypothetical protein
VGRLRLDQSLSHLPVVPEGEKGNHVCQLHRWASGSTIPPGARNMVCRCSACAVNVCLQCYELFHTETNLPSKIDWILSNK